eukprot:3935598-Rhodomonas_salina.3
MPEQESGQKLEKQRGKFGGGRERMEGGKREGRWEKSDARAQTSCRLPRQSYAAAPRVKGVVDPSGVRMRCLLPTHQPGRSMIYQCRAPKSLCVKNDPCQYQTLLASAQGMRQPAARNPGTSCCSRARITAAYLDVEESACCFASSASIARNRSFEFLSSTSLAASRARACAILYAAGSASPVSNSTFPPLVLYTTATESKSPHAQSAPRRVAERACSSWNDVTA